VAAGPPIGSGASENHATAWRSSERESVGLCIADRRRGFGERSPGQTVLGIYSMAKVLATLRWTKVSVIATARLPDHGWLQTDRSANARRLPERAATGCLYNVRCVWGRRWSLTTRLHCLTDKWQPMCPCCGCSASSGWSAPSTSCCHGALCSDIGPRSCSVWTVVLLLVMPFRFLTGCLFRGGGRCLALIVVYPIIWPGWRGRAEELASA